jgi:hypothetical protein
LHHAGATTGWGIETAPGFSPGLSHIGALEIAMEASLVRIRLKSRRACSIISEFRFHINCRFLNFSFLTIYYHLQLSTQSAYLQAKNHNAWQNCLSLKMARRYNTRFHPSNHFADISNMVFALPGDWRQDHEARNILRPAN